MDLKSKLLDVILDHAAELVKDPEGVEIFTYWQIPPEVFSNAHESYAFLSEEDVICLISTTPEKRGESGIVFTERNICTNDGYQKSGYSSFCPYGKYREYNQFMAPGYCEADAKMNIPALKELMKILYFITKMTNENGEEYLDYKKLLDDIQNQIGEYPDNDFNRLSMIFYEQFVLECMLCVDNIDRPDHYDKDDRRDLLIDFWTSILEQIEEYTGKLFDSPEANEEFLMLCHFWSTLFYQPEDYLMLFDAEVLSDLPEQIQKISLETELMIVKNSQDDFDLCEYLDAFGDETLPYVQKIYDAAENEELEESKFQELSGDCLNHCKVSMEGFAELIEEIIYRLKPI